MAFKAVHPDNTDTVRLPDGADEADQAEFTVGFWPPREAERFHAMLDEMRKPSQELNPVTEQDDYLKAIGLNYEVACDMVRFGVRGWSGLEDADGKAIAPDVGSVTIDGRVHPILGDGSIHMLYVNRLVAVLAMRCWVFNALTPAQKKTLMSPSDSLSSTTPTDAESAIPSGRAPTLEAV